MELTVDEHAGKVRIWLDGKEVTNKCFYAQVPDDEGVEGQGYIGVYARDDEGNLILEDGDVVIEDKRGLVRWEWR